MKTTRTLMPFGNSETHVPKGQLRIVQRFNAGVPTAPRQVPKGQLKKGVEGCVQSSNLPGSAGILPASFPVLWQSARTPAPPASGSRSGILESWRLSLSRIHAVEQEITEGTEIWEPVETIVCSSAQISWKGGSAQRIGLRGKSILSLRFLRSLLFLIENLRLSREARTFLSAAFTTGSLLLLCPAPVQAQGGVPLWTKHFEGPANTWLGTPAPVAVDSSGNVFVSGASRPSMNGTDCTIIKYSNGGVPLWPNYYNGPDNGHEEAGATAVDNSGNVFVPYVTETIKYSGLGTPLWTNWTNLSGGNAMAVDSSGNLFVTGSNDDYATIKYSNAGVPLWTNRYNGPRNLFDWPTSIAVDRNGNVFVTGFESDANRMRDYATIAYSNAGEPLWEHRYDGPANGRGLAGHTESMKAPAMSPTNASERVLKLGSAGDSPAPVGPSSVAALLRRVDDPPTGIAVSYGARGRPLGSNRCPHSVRRVAGRHRRVACATRKRFFKQALSDSVSPGAGNTKTRMMPV